MTIDSSAIPLTIPRVTITRRPSNVYNCRNWHLQYVADHMRADEIVQYEAFVGKFDADSAARLFMALPGFKFSVLDDEGIPAASGGYHEVSSGVWQSWMAGTPQGWATHWRSITRASRWMMDGLFEMGARRLQTNALASRTQTIEWYERSLGLEREGTLRQFGANGEDVAIFSRIK